VALHVILNFFITALFKKASKHQQPYQSSAPEAAVEVKSLF